MQFRFREYNKEKQKYNLITLTDIEDYDTAFKMFTFMKEHKCEYSVEINLDAVVESSNCCIYEVEDISFCVSAEHGEERLLPHIVVDLVEAG